jgi:peptidoglycan/LPS O-acetylase OafA/YrhL
LRALDFLGSDHYATAAIVAFAAGGVAALFGASRQRGRRLMWIALALGLFGVLVVACGIWFATTQSR